MKKIIIALAIFLLPTIALAAVFNSSQVGTSPSVGYVLQTNGATSTWVATSSLGFSGGPSTDTLQMVTDRGATTSNKIFVGATATSGDFASANAIFSAGDSGYSNTGRLGLVGESVSGDGLVGLGLGGVSKTSGVFPAYGVAGVAKVDATGDAGGAVGVQGLSQDTHAGGSNIGVYGAASGGTLNYSFFGLTGKLFNEDNIETDSGIVTTAFKMASSSGNGKVFISDADGNAAWIATSSLGITSGATPAGNNGEIQFNSNGALGATSSLSFSTTTNTFTIASSGVVIGGNDFTYSLNDASTTINNLTTGTLNFDTNAGIVTGLDMSVTGSAATSSEQGYAFSVGGTPNMYIYGTANGIAGGVTNLRVGIGTSTPSARLAIAGTSASTENLLVVGSSSTSQFPYLMVTPTGRIGSGTSTPAAKLSIRGVTGDTYPLVSITPTSNLPVIFADSAGLVGIGTSTVTTGSALTVANVANTTDATMTIKNPGTGRGLLIDAQSSTNAALVIQSPVSTSLTTGIAFTGIPTGATFGTYAFYSDGKFGIGPGSATRDVFLSRIGTGQMMISGNGSSTYSGATDGDLLITKNLLIGTSTGLTRLSVQGRTGSTTDLFNIASSSGATLFKVAYDGIQTKVGSFAEIYVHDASTTVQSIPATVADAYTKITAFTNDGLSSGNVVADSANDRIVISKAGKYRFSASTSFSDGNNVTWTMTAFVGGVEQKNIHFSRKLGASGDVGSASLSGYFTATSSTIVELGAQHNQVGATDIDVWDANMNVEYIGE